jgi:hypothetical protein
MHHSFTDTILLLLPVAAGLGSENLCRSKRTLARVPTDDQSTVLQLAALSGPDARRVSRTRAGCPILALTVRRKGGKPRTLAPAVP